VTDTQHKKAGDFCWVELCTPDIDKAKTFYQGILNWQFDDVPMPEGPNYTMIKVGEDPVAGGFQITPEMQSEGLVPHWSSYILVDDVDSTTERAKTLGATVFKEPFDVPEMGRMSVLQDPTGAAFNLWQPKQEPGKALAKNEPGNFGWNELATTDTDKAGKFYSDLLGWKRETKEMAPGKIYTSFINDGTPVGGMLELTEDWNGAPPHWGVYFSVSNIDTTITKAKDLSGTILYEPISYPDVGRFTRIRDPQGVHFSVIEFSKS